MHPSPTVRWDTAPSSVDGDSAPGSSAATPLGAAYPGGSPLLASTPQPAGAQASFYPFAHKTGPLRRKWALSKPLFAVLEKGEVRVGGL